jgi:hypothetical protein
LVQDLLIAGGPHSQTSPWGRSNPQASQMTCLEAQQTQNWSVVGSLLSNGKCAASLHTRNYAIPVRKKQSQHLFRTMFQNVPLHT